MASSHPPEPRSDLLIFASMLEARKQLLDTKGRTALTDPKEVMSKLFELIHDARDAINGRTSLSIIASDIALLAMELAKTDGPFSTNAAKKDSIRVIDAHKQAVRDSSHKHVIVHHDKATLWGAVLEADFEVTEDSLKPCLSAIRSAIDTLHAFSVKVGKIQIANGFVKVFPEDGTKDPRNSDISIPINPER